MRLTYRIFWIPTFQWSLTPWIKPGCQKTERSLYSRTSHISWIVTWLGPFFTYSHSNSLCMHCLFCASVSSVNRAKPHPNRFHGKSTRMQEDVLPSQCHTRKIMCLQKAGAARGGSGNVWHISATLIYLSRKTLVAVLECEYIYI